MGVAAGGAYPAATTLLRCASNIACRNELSLAIGEAAAGDAFAGTTLATTAVAGRMVLQKGDEILGFIDETTGRLIPTNLTSGNRAEKLNLINDLMAGGTRITPENVVDIRNVNGRTVWLETGSATAVDGRRPAGLSHIIADHGPEFTQRGISEAEIPDVLFTALQRNNVVDYQGTGTGRPVFEFDYRGQTHRVAITASDNGFIVGANFRSLP